MHVHTGDTTVQLNNTAVIVACAYVSGAAPSKTCRAKHPAAGVCSPAAMAFMRLLVGSAALVERAELIGGFTVPLVV